MYPLIKVSFSFDSIPEIKPKTDCAYFCVKKKHLNKDNDYSR
jgi:hypothetical protein